MQAERLKGPLLGFCLAQRLFSAQDTLSGNWKDWLEKKLDLLFFYFFFW